MTLVLEPRETVSRRFVWGVTFAALLVALLISGIVIWWVGGDPVRSFVHIVDSAFGSVGVISDTLVKATPLILTGLACSLAFRRIDARLADWLMQASRRQSRWPWQYPNSTVRQEEIRGSQTARPYASSVLNLPGRL